MVDFQIAYLSCVVWCGVWCAVSCLVVWRGVALRDVVVVVVVCGCSGGVGSVGGMVGMVGVLVLCMGLGFLPLSPCPLAAWRGERERIFPLLLPWEDVTAAPSKRECGKQHHTPRNRLTRDCKWTLARKRKIM